MQSVEVKMKPGGTFAADFCSSRHPERDDVWCRRMKRHDGDHSAFVHKISEPETWPNEEQP